MFDPVTTKEIVGFVIATALGCLSYALATLIARLISSEPRRVYIGRLIFIVVFLMLVWVFYVPTAYSAFSGDRNRYYERRMEERGMGTSYGMLTTYIWLILAALKWPRERKENPGQKD